MTTINIFSIGNGIFLLCIGKGLGVQEHRALQSRSEQVLLYKASSFLLVGFRVQGV